MAYNEDEEMCSTEMSITEEQTPSTSNIQVTLSEEPVPSTSGMQMQFGYEENETRTSFADEPNPSTSNYFASISGNTVSGLSSNNKALPSTSGSTNDSDEPKPSTSGVQDRLGSASAQQNDSEYSGPSSAVQAPADVLEEEVVTENFSVLNGIFKLQ